jgi:hypothetical protein
MISNFYWMMILLIYGVNGIPMENPAPVKPPTSKTSKGVSQVRCQPERLARYCTFLRRPFIIPILCYKMHHKHPYDLAQALSRMVGKPSFEHPS